MGVCNRGYERLVPDRFLRTSAISKHRFGVIDPWWQPFEIVELQSGKLEAIEPSAFCRLSIGNIYVSLLVPVATNRRMASSIFDLAQLSTGTRSAKYVALFKLYETFCPQPKIEFAALRHAFTHSRAVLNRPKTVAALNSMFGTVHIDLERLRHQKIFWDRYGELLIEVDKLVTAEAEALGEKVKMPQAYKRPLTKHIAQYYFPDQSAKLTNHALKADVDKAPQS